MKIYNRNAIVALYQRCYHKRHIAIIMGTTEQTINQILKQENIDEIEPTLQFLSFEQKQRLFVLDKFLQLKPVGTKWCSNDYYYITILKFLLVPREVIYSIYKSAPMVQVAQAHKEKAPKLQLFDYTALQINSEEYNNFVMSCYKIINDPEKWK